MRAVALCKCEFCGKPFNSVGIKLCEECMQEIDDSYVKVRKYLYQSPDAADFASIVDRTGVSEEILSYLMEQGRIMIKNGGSGELRCKACGKGIDSGVLCEQCMKKLVAENLISKLYQPAETPLQKRQKIKPLREQD